MVTPVGSQERRSRSMSTALTALLVREPPDLEIAGQALVDVVRSTVADALREHLPAELVVDPTPDAPFTFRVRARGRPERPLDLRLAEVTPRPKEAFGARARSWADWLASRILGEVERRAAERLY